MKNEEGFTLLLVLIILMFFSMITMNLLKTYQHEQQFAILENEQFRLDLLVINGMQEVIEIVDQAGDSYIEGPFNYREGDVIYEVDEREGDSVVSLTAMTEMDREKQVTFIYNGETKQISEWKEK